MTRDPSHSRDASRLSPGPAQVTESRAWPAILSASLVLIVCVRLFSENLRLVSRLAQFVDVPVTVAVAVLALMSIGRSRRRVAGKGIGVITYLFVALCAVSALVNVSRVSALPALMFVYGLLAPFVFDLAVAHVPLGRQGVQRVVRTFYWLGVVQLVIGVGYGLPMLFATRNPDYVSGTFGQNAYQFTYFIGLWLLYVLGSSVMPVERPSRMRDLAVAVAALLVFGLFYAAQYRAMLVFFAAIVAIALGASPARLPRRIWWTLMVLVVSTVMLVFVATLFPNLKLLRTFDLLADSTPIIESGKVQAVRNVVVMYEEMPHTILFGSGPATHSSRGYRTFALDPRAEKDAAGPLALALMGGTPYGTDVARKYVDTIYAPPIQGGTTASSVMSSFTALAAEVGLPGLFLYLAAYGLAIGYSYRRMRVSADAADAQGFALAFACFGGLLLLLTQALFDNWLETTRVAIPLWTLVGLLYALEAAEPRVEGQHDTRMRASGRGGIE
jgi:hypothetical protein